MKPLSHVEMEGDCRQPTSKMSVKISWNSPVVKTFLSIHDVQNFTEVAFGKKKEVQRDDEDAVSLSSSISSSNCSDDESVSSSSSASSRVSDQDSSEEASPQKRKAKTIRGRKGQKAREGNNKRKRKRIKKTPNRKTKVKYARTQKATRVKDRSEKASLPKLSSLALKSFVLLKPLAVDKGTPRCFRLAQICKHLKGKKQSEVHFWETYAKLGNKVSSNHRYFPAWSNPENGVEIYQNFRSKFAVPMTWNISDKDLIHAFADMGPRNTFPTSVIRVVNKLISGKK